MKELRDIVAAYRQVSARGQAAALATIISVEGSSYRQAGARMLIAEDGCMTGAISGGCLEGDALRKARLVMERSVPKLVRYDTRDDDDAKLGLGLGCKGIIEVLIEPLLVDDPANPVRLLEAACGRRIPQVLVTHASGAGGGQSRGTCMLLSDDDAQTLGAMSTDAIAAARASLASGESRLLRTDETVTFFELLKPGLRLMIYGAGNDAIPLVKLAAVLGWETLVIDGRPAYATAERFPEAGELRLLRLDQLSLLPVPDSRSAAVLMSHNYNYDIAALRLLLDTDVPYIGALGPRRKLLRMYDELGIHPDDAPGTVFGPTGLDIGASTPEEIALSIVAEIQAMMTRRDGVSLRDRREPIHAG